MEKKINAYNKAFFLACKHKNERKRNAIADKLHLLEYTYWERIIKDSEHREKKINIPLLTSHTAYHDVNIINLACGYDITENKDIYGSDFPLCTDKVYTHVTSGIDTVRANYLIKDKHANQDITGTPPQYEQIDSANYFAVEKEHTKYTPRVRKKRWRTIVRKKHGSEEILKTRYKIEQKDLMYLLGGVAGYNRSVKVTKHRDSFYLAVDQFRIVTDYLSSISLDTLYSEKIRSLVICQSCKSRKNYLSSYENNLSCRFCGQVNYKLKTYRIRYFYINVFIRYELNELKGVVRKQIETSHGFKVIYEGKIKA